MTSNVYGNMGGDMRTMELGRKNLRAEIKDNANRIRAETGHLLADADKFMAETHKANAKLNAQTHQMLAEADKVMAGIRKDVAALQAEASQILADADRFMVQTKSGNVELETQTHRGLAQARKFMAQVKRANKGQQAQTRQMLADATEMVSRFAKDSRARVAAWRDVLHTVHGGNGRRASAPPAGRMAAMTQPARQKAANRSGGAARSAKRKPARASKRR